MKCSTRQRSLREIPSYNTKTVILCTTLDLKEHFHVCITSAHLLDINSCKLSQFKGDVNVICVTHRQLYHIKVSSFSSCPNKSHQRHESCNCEVVYNHFVNCCNMHLGKNDLDWQEHDNVCSQTQWVCIYILVFAALNAKLIKFKRKSL